MADSGSSRDLILAIATEMNRTPEQMEKFIASLEGEMLDTVDSLRDLSDQDFKDLGFPIGLVKKIKQRLEPAASSSAPAQAQPVQQVQMIDTSGGAQRQASVEEEKKEVDISPLSVTEKAMICLDNIQDSDIQAPTPEEKKAKVKGVIQTLFKVISNIITSPFEPKFRKLPKNAGTVREKILANPNAVNFLKLAGFRFDQPGDHIIINAYSKDELESCLTAIKIFVERLGGEVHDP